MASPRNVNIISEEEYQGLMHTIRYDMLARIKPHEPHDALILTKKSCPPKYIAIRLNWLNNELKSLTDTSCNLSPFYRNLTKRICEEFLFKINQDISKFYNAGSSDIYNYMRLHL